MEEVGEEVVEEVAEEAVGVEVAEEAVGVAVGVGVGVAVGDLADLVDALKPLCRTRVEVCAFFKVVPPASDAVHEATERLREERVARAVDLDELAAGALDVGKLDGQ